MMDDDPFPEMKISDTTALDLADKREICSFCGRKRMYFCYSCIRYVNNLEEAMPKVKLPVKIDIIKHKQELDSKSTAVHAALLAPHHCVIHSFPNIPTYNPKTDVVVFPSEDCISVEQWAERTSSTEGHTASGHHMQTVVFIDCTWNQITPIINCQQLAGLPKIGMRSYSTKFWRPNGLKRDATYLSTIEAIYYFLKEYHISYLGLPYDGQYDNLLMLFKYIYLKIKDFHNGGGQLRAYKT